MSSTRLGFLIRAHGGNRTATTSNEVRPGRLPLLLLILGGALAGVAGFVQLAGVQTRFAAGSAAGFGFTAIIVAIVGRNHPVGVLVSAIGFSAMLVGAEARSATADCRQPDADDPGAGRRVRRRRRRPRRPACAPGSAHRTGAAGGGSTAYGMIGILAQSRRRDARASGAPCSASGVRLAVSVGTAAIGEMINERAGVLNLGLEGVMLLGGFAGFAASFESGSPWVGLAVRPGGRGGRRRGLRRPRRRACASTRWSPDSASRCSASPSRRSSIGRSTAEAPVRRAPRDRATSRSPCSRTSPLVGEALFAQNAVVYVAIGVVVVVAVVMRRSYWRIVRRRRRRSAARRRRRRPLGHAGALLSPPSSAARSAASPEPC